MGKYLVRPKFSTLLLMLLISFLMLERLLRTTTDNANVEQKREDSSANELLKKYTLTWPLSGGSHDLEDDGKDEDTRETSWKRLDAKDEDEYEDRDAAADDDDNDENEDDDNDDDEINDATDYDDGEENKDKDKENDFGGTNDDDDEATEEEITKFDAELLRLKDSPYIYIAERDLERPPPSANEGPVIWVSAYLPYDVTYMKYGVGKEGKSFKNCPYHNCLITDDMSEADVIIFRAGSIRNYGVNKTWHRSPKQRWIMTTIDPAVKNYKLSDPRAKSSFNLTWTYQLSSDIPRLMGKLYRRKLPNINYAQIYKGKTKLAAWFVSNCGAKSLRGDYVKRMQAVAPVDVFGRCGTMNCGGRREDSHSDCFPMLTRTYKFYLSFESAFCKDYVTEKYFKLFDNIQVIPVVRGALNYDQLLPKNTYVNTADFDSPEDLAKYLIKLGNDEIRYISMLKEKNRWGTYKPNWNCDLCKKLTTLNHEGRIEDLRERFEGPQDDPECHPPTDL